MVSYRAEYEVIPASSARTAAMMGRQGRARFLTLAICWARSCCRFSWRSTGVILPGLEMRDPGGPPGLRDHGTLSRPPIPLATPAAEAYHATTAVTTAM